MKKITEEYKEQTIDCAKKTINRYKRGIKAVKSGKKLPLLCGSRICNYCKIWQTKTCSECPQVKFTGNHCTSHGSYNVVTLATLVYNSESEFGQIHVTDEVKDKFIYTINIRIKYHKNLIKLLKIRNYETKI